MSEPARAAARSPAGRVHDQPGLVLHSYPWRETSLLVDIFTRDHGRLAVVAKGAKRPYSALRGTLQTFQPLSLSWSGKGEVRTLTRADWVGGMPPLSGQALLCGFYINELIVRFCAREDAHETLFDHYLLTLARLGNGEAPAPALRSFERVLLGETGYAVALDWCTAAGAAVDPAQRYVFHPERGVRPAGISDPVGWPQVRGATLLAMMRDDFQDPQTLAESKQLMRFLINHHLHGAPLSTRQILMELNQL